ncbi:MAG: hypothetical protein OCD02_20720 [Spirochaetaceae bacterium]
MKTDEIQKTGLILKLPNTNAKQNNNRTLLEVINDIDTIKYFVDGIGEILNSPVRSNKGNFNSLIVRNPNQNEISLETTMNWMGTGMESIILEHNDSVKTEKDEVERIVKHLENLLPNVNIEVKV